MKIIQDGFVSAAQLFIRLINPSESGSVNSPWFGGMWVDIDSGGASESLEKVTKRRRSTWRARFASLLDAAYEDAKNPRNRNKVLFIIWILGIVLTTLITVFLLLIYPLTSPNAKTGILLAAILWGFFFGVAALFFLPARGVTATFGALLGISLNETFTAAGLITRANQQITSVAVVINPIFADSPSDLTSHFIGQVIWAFLITLLLVCLPSFFLADETLHSSRTA